jgi:hypothetical protein
LNALLLVVISCDCVDGGGKFNGQTPSPRLHATNLMQISTSKPLAMLGIKEINFHSVLLKI